MTRDEKETIFLMAYLAVTGILSVWKICEIIVWVCNNYSQVIR